MTTTTLSLAQFLEGRLAEAEAAALAATPGPWVQGSTHSTYVDDNGMRHPLVTHEHVAATGAETIMVADMNTHPIIGHPTIPPRNEANSAHIAAWDPARVLAQVAATRAIVGLHRTYGDYGERCNVCQDPEDELAAGEPWPCTTLRHLAAPYASHPDFDPAWVVS